MRHMIAFTVILALALAGAAPASGQETDTRPGIVVFPFDNGGSYGPDAQDMTALSVGLQQILLTELNQHEDLRIVERSQLRSILAELELSETDRIDAATAARVGRLVGARYAVAGSFTDWYGRFRIDARVFSVETSEILNTEQVQEDRERLYAMVVDLAGRVMEDVDLEPLEVAQVEARRERDIPPAAVILYSRAQVLQDDGHRDRAIELYTQITRDFPEYTEARDALAGLQSDAP